MVGGTPSTKADDSVVLILTHIASKDPKDGQYFLPCTGTLLAPNLVLTARHCVSPTGDGVFTCNVDGSVRGGSGATFAADVPPSESHVFVGAARPDTLDPSTFPSKGASFVHDASSVVCNADVALIVLSQPILDAPISPVRLDAPVTKGEMLTVVGWGATETESLPQSRRRRAGVQVVNVGPDTTAFVGGELGAKEFIASESVCTGDSGGPAFDATTNAVVGVASRGSNGGITKNGSGCVGTEHVFMQTASFKELVLRAFAEAGAEPWLEGEPQPKGESSQPAPEAGVPVTDKDAGTPAAASPTSSEASGCVVGPPGVNADFGRTFGIGIAASLLAFVRRRQRGRIS